MSVSFEVLSVYNELYLEGFYSTILNPTLVLTNFQILATAMYTHTHTHTHWFQCFMGRDLATGWHLSLAIRLLIYL